MLKVHFLTFRIFKSWLFWRTWSNLYW